ncbi:MAG: hypothetical protein H5U30_17385, partial [Marinobacter sp.]|nr:hypothetical protein [Marinobacter sp.]
VIFFAVNAGMLDNLPADKVAEAEQVIQQHLLEALPEICAQMDSGKKLEDEQWLWVTEAIEAALAAFTPTETDQA